MSEFSGNTQKGAKVAEGKTKIIWEIPGSTDVLIESKDDITAGDGAKKDQFPGKAELATRTTVNVFERIQAAGIPTHYIAPYDERTFRARGVNMVPIELVARRVAFGSYLKRDPATPERTVFPTVVFETFAKDDPNHDPILIYDFENGTVSRYSAKEPFSPGSLLDERPIDESLFGLTEGGHRILRRRTIDVFELLEAAWAKQNVTLVDLKIEAGYARDTGELLIADVIDNDSWRIWPGGDPNQMKDKQLYRDGAPLADVADSYAWVADATDRFVE